MKGVPSTKKTVRPAMNYEIDGLKLVISRPIAASVTQHSGAFGVVYC